MSSKRLHPLKYFMEVENHLLGEGQWSFKRLFSNHRFGIRISWSFKRPCMAMPSTLAHDDPGSITVPFAVVPFQTVKPHPAWYVKPHP